MSVLIFVDHSEGHISKSSFEALSYGFALAKQMNMAANAVLVGNVSNEEAASLGKYGVEKTFLFSGDVYNHVDAQVYAKAVAEAVKESDASVVIFSHNQTGRAVAPRVAAKLKAGLVTGVIRLPQTDAGFVVRKTVFSGKAFANVDITSPIKIITLTPNNFGVKENGDAGAEVVTINTNFEAKVKTTATNKVSGEVPLTEAEIVVSGGRGLKGPENWGMVEDLAHTLHAALACSRPVADAHWRPHHEHVGQTGIQISPNLYFALGISGAIQHLAGVNKSKVIVVINKDAEAPFFKAADYGIVGDLFDVVPKLTEEIKKLKGA